MRELDKPHAVRPIAASPSVLEANALALKAWSSNG